MKTLMISLLAVTACSSASQPSGDPEVTAAGVGSVSARFLFGRALLATPSEDLGEVLAQSSRTSDAPAIAGRKAAETLLTFSAHLAEIEPLDCGRIEGRESAAPARLLSGALRSVEFVPTRSIDPSRPASAFRMTIDSERGPGAIVRFDRPAGECYSGRGVFLDWPQAALRQAFHRFSPEGEAALSMDQLD